MDVFEDFLWTLEGFQILMGSDSLILPGLALGGVGAVSALADVFPEKVVALYELFGQGKLKEATEIQHQLCALRDVSKAGYSSIACLKSMLRLRGLDLRGVRAPAKSLSPPQEEELKKRLRELG